MSSLPLRPSPNDDLPLVDGIWGYVVYSENYREPFGPNTVTIDRADPQALILDEILHEAHDRLAGIFEPTLRASVLRLVRPPAEIGHCNTPRDVCQYPSHPLCYTDWMLHIDIPGRHLVYRVGNYRPVDNCWEISWPD